MPKDGRRYELVRGELRTMTQAGHPHGRVAIRIAWPLAQHGEERGLGTVYAAETGFLLAKDPDTVRARRCVRAPRARRGDRRGGRLLFRGAGSGSRGGLSRRRVRRSGGQGSRMARSGARMVIVVDPSNRTVTIHRSLTDVAVLTHRRRRDRRRGRGPGVASARA